MKTNQYLTLTYHSYIPLRIQYQIKIFLSFRSQDDSKSRFKPKFLRAKFRDSKTWGKKSVTNNEEKEQSSSTNGNSSDINNGHLQSVCQGASNSTTPNTSSIVSASEVPESRLSRLFSLRRSVGPGNHLYA